MKEKLDAIYRELCAINKNQKHTNKALSKLIDVLSTKNLTKKPDDIFKESIKILGLSNKTYNCLDRSNIKTIEDLVRRTEEDIKHIRFIGLKAYSEVISCLENHKLTLNVNICEMCGENMSIEDHDYCDMCSECLEELQ
jgi:DNA-directed RNA polymerase alpha subunit|tara:strand:+ start:575 stop:991 length:417 start_codon:yes stop_codon:yes gene_type:complete